METSLHQHFLVDIIVQGFHIKAMIDSGAQGSYISPNLVNRLRLPWNKKDKPYRLRNVEGKYVAYEQGSVDRETAPLTVRIAGTTQSLVLDITEISNKDIILGIPWLRASNPRVNWRTGQLQWDLPGSQSPEVERERPPQAPHRDYGQQALSIYVISREPCKNTIEIPHEYSRYKKLFSEELETGLPEHSQWDHEITLRPGTTPKLHKAYPLNEKNRKVLEEYLEENLRKGYIRPSKSPAGYPILFVPKKNGKTRVCVDYRQLNDITVKNGYMLPLIAEIRDKTYGAMYFTTLDLRGAYNLIRMKEGDEWKTAFRTTMGHYEYLVMPFGLTNAPATFQCMIDQVLREYSAFTVIYLDDILIFSATLGEHKKHVHQVLQALENAKLLVEPAKCEFHKQKVKFLGYELTPGEIRMDPAKVECIQNWPTPQNLTEVQSFLGLANFYRRFIEKYSHKAMALTDLTKKDTKFTWGPKQEESFQNLKKAISSEPVLIIPDPTKPFEVETDASGYAMGGQLTQRDEQNRPHPVAFFSKKFHGPEINYGIPDQELMAIIEAFKEWRHYLSGTTEPVKVLTDHKNLTSFTTTKDLNKRQIRWSEFMSEFNFVIIHVKGTENGRADALSRRLDHKENEEMAPTAIFRKNKEGHLEPVIREINMTWTVEPDESWLNRARAAYAKDEYLKEWRNNPRITTKTEDGLFRYLDNYYLPKTLQKEFTRECHEHPLHGHQGVYKTHCRLKTTFDFPGSKEMVQKVVRECDTCNKAKATRHAPYGELKPIATPDRAWKVIAWDFVVKLPPSKEPMTKTTYDSIFVVTDKLTKYALFIPYKESSSAEELAYIFTKEVAAAHGLPEQIISDRDKLFTSNFWQSLMKRLGVKSKLSTAYHPQTDGQTERLNQVLEQYLRSYVNYQQNNWVELLPLAQWAYNSSENEKLGMSPFKANYGYNPAMNTIQEGGLEAPASTELAQKIVDTQREMKKELDFLQNRMAHYYNKKRLSAPILKEGDKVYLTRRYIKTDRPNDKLDWKRFGPFKIEKKLSDVTYKLSLPLTMRIHPVFHISLLEPAPTNVRINTSQQASPEFEQGEYEVEDILNQRIHNGRIEYLVKWKGYDDAENTWEPKSHFPNKTMLNQYHRRKQETPPKMPRGRPARNSQRLPAKELLPEPPENSSQSRQNHQELARR